MAMINQQRGSNAQRRLFHQRLTKSWLIVFFAFSILSSSVFAQGNVLISLPPSPDYGQKQLRAFLKENRIQTVAEYAQWLKAHITYQADQGGDIWSFPEETLKRGGGDCEDLAFLNASILRLLGYQPHVLVYIQSKQAHAFCIFKKDGRFEVFDNLDLIVTTLTSVSDFAKFGIKNKKMQYVVELPDESPEDSQILARSGS